MVLSDAARPRVSRETRRLLAAAGLALLALWILARLRFPERPASANPVATVLTQISPPTTFSDLAAEVDRVRRRVAPVLAEVTWPVPQAPGGARTFPAWPFRDKLADRPAARGRGDRHRATAWSRSIHPPAWLSSAPPVLVPSRVRFGYPISSICPATCSRRCRPACTLPSFPYSSACSSPCAALPGRPRSGGCRRGAV